MLGTVLVGYDGSDSARDAVALGEILTEHVRTDLVVARVFPWAPGKAPEDRALAELEEVARLAGGRVEVVAGEAPSSGLQDLAAESGAGLLIVGSCGGDDRRTVAGQVGLSLLQGAPCPVAVAPRGFARRYAPDIRLIAVGYDGSEEAGQALLGAGRLAKDLGAKLRVIAVPSVGLGSRRRLEESLPAALASLPPQVQPGAVMRSGQPAAVLLEEADSGADLLLVGSSRHGPVHRALLGSVSTELVRQAPCPVVVVPRATRQSRGDVPLEAAVARR